jgi:hypothetical protein
MNVVITPEELNTFISNLQLMNILYVSVVVLLIVGGIISIIHGFNKTDLDPFVFGVILFVVASVFLGITADNLKKMDDPINALAKNKYNSIQQNIEKEKIKAKTELAKTPVTVTFDQNGNILTVNQITSEKKDE